MSGTDMTLRFSHFVTLFAATCAGQVPQWVTPNISAPGLEQRTFESTAAKAKVSYFLSLPEVYGQQPRQRFPVLYWLHGTGGGGAGVAFLSNWFRTAAREGKMSPLIVVFPNGLRAGMWCDSVDGRAPVETVVIKELIPHIDATFRTVAGRQGRIVEGFSMGGYGAARFAFLYPNLFAAASILAAGPLDLELRGPRAQGNPAERERLLKDVYGGELRIFQEQSPIRLAEKHAAAVRAKVYLRHAVGRADSTYELNRLFHEQLLKLRIPHSFAAPEGVDHDPRALLRALGEENWEFYQKALEGR